MGQNRGPGLRESGSVAVVFQSKVRDEILTHDVAQGVFQLHVLDKEIVLGVDALG